ncbi:MAG TPA: hypothetical protein VHU19_15630 [Pyrinomonadaceae bacterium]|nr:hypothetical protein [Pyrinomonadaceae bacterium]
MQKVTHLGLPNCYLLTNGTVEVVVASDVGPRVLGYGFAGGRNVLGECPGESVATEWGEFKPWGGHRLWTSPEAKPRSYAPDNDAVEVVNEGERVVRLVGAVEARTGVGKEIAVALDAEGSGVTLRHRIMNHGAWRVELGAWGLTIMRGGGEVIIPQEPYGPHPQNLLPARTLVVWPYTDMADARMSFGRKFIRVRTDAASKEPNKLGVANKQGWAAYLLEGTLFVKCFRYEEGASYPDIGCNNEVFTAGSFIELESLSPLKQLEPGEAVEHTERWELFEGVKGVDDEDELDAVVSRFVASARDGLSNEAI